MGNYTYMNRTNCQNGCNEQTPGGDSIDLNEREQKDNLIEKSGNVLKSLHFILAQSGNSIIATACPLKSS